MKRKGVSFQIDLNVITELDKIVKKLGFSKPVLINAVLIQMLNKTDEEIFDIVREYQSNLKINKKGE